MSVASNGIIIYRSRAEQEIDNMLWNSDGSGIEIFCIVMVIALTVVTLYSTAIKEMGYRSRYKKFVGPGALVVGVPLGYGIAKFLGWLILAI